VLGQGPVYGYGLFFTELPLLQSLFFRLRFFWIRLRMTKVFPFPTQSSIRLFSRNFSQLSPDPAQLFGGASFSACLPTSHSGAPLIFSSIPTVSFSAGSPFSFSTSHGVKWVALPRYFKSFDFFFVDPLVEHSPKMNPAGRCSVGL